MFKKLNTRSLLIVFAVLLAAVLLKTLLDNKKGDRSFSSELVAFDTAKVQSISITPKNDFDRFLKFEKDGGQWFVSKGEHEYEADESMVRNILSTLIDIKPKSLVATEKGQWRDYEVTDSMATQVVVEGKKGVLAHVYIGKFDYQQPARQDPQMMMYGQRQQGVMRTFVRAAGDKNVYVTEGFLGMTFNQDVNQYRNKTVINSASSKWKSLTFTYPADSSFRLTNENGNWMINGLAADSAKVVRYLNKLDMQNSTNFIDNTPAATNAALSLKIEGDNMQPILVNAYAADSLNQYIINSSQNNKAYFSGAKGNLMNNIFISAGSLMSEIN